MVRGLGWIVILLSCGQEEVAERDLPALQSAQPTTPVVRRLTETQYEASLLHLFGEGLVMPNSLEPDQAVEGFLSVGSAKTSISPRGAELYESGAYLVAEQVVTEPFRERWMVCEPQQTDEDCAWDNLEALAYRAWRRPVESEEVASLVDVASLAAETLGDFHDGMTYGVAAVLQSPSFLFRVENGEPSGSAGQRYTDYEMASRLSFFLWNGPPDDPLLEAAHAGELVEEDALAKHVQRMLEDDKLGRGIRNVFYELYTLYELDELSKDPTVFPHMTEDVGPSAQEETLHLIEQFALSDHDFLDLLTTKTTYINRTLAAIYAIQAPEREGFGEITFPSDDPRTGLLGHTSILAQHSHAVSTSPTLRGKFIRETLLCHAIPDPPADLNTSIPEPSDENPTLRDRVQQHLEVEYCAACHVLTDPIGLGLENFDGLGRFRTTENGYLIDASGDLDGEVFSDVPSLASVLRDHGDVGPCLTENLYRYAVGRPQTSGELDLLDSLATRFTRQEHALRDLMRDIVMSEGFRLLDPVDVDEESSS
jgi:hypothetical protein